jgi:hypothetical protein
LGGTELEFELGENELTGLLVVSAFLEFLFTRSAAGTLFSLGVFEELDVEWIEVTPEWLAILSPVLSATSLGVSLGVGLLAPLETG